MRERSIGAVGVVLVGIIPTVLGGPAFLLLMLFIGLVGYHEYRHLACRVGSPPSNVGYAVIAALALAGLSRDPLVILLGVAIAVVAPFALAVFQAGRFGVPGTGHEERPSLGAVGWSQTAVGTLYLGLPVAGAIALRNMAGTSDRGWVNDLANASAFGWEAHPVGMGWLLTLILVTWFGDTAAYLVGRSFGKRPLMLNVSPKKTVEGSLGGLAGSAIAGGLGVWIFGLGTPVLVGALVGIALGACGQVGDLGESLLKRQAGVKDSGHLIRGHGGMLDRVDALLVVLTFGWFLVEFAR